MKIYARCPGCFSFSLQRCSDDDREEDYLECLECGGEWDLDGFRRRKK